MSQRKAAALLADQIFGREDSVIFLTQEVNIAGKRAEEKSTSILSISIT